MSAAVGSPPRVDLATETEGALPPALTTTTAIASFSFRGTLEAGPSESQWVNEFNDAQIVSFRGVLGRDRSPAAQPVIVALEQRAADTDTWDPYPETSAVAIGTSIGAPANPTGAVLVPGDGLRAVVVQTGGGAIPSDGDLTVTVTLAVRHGSTTTTYPWET
jgi:hypothetical protein